MQQIHCTDQVQLALELTELHLRRGATGVVRTSWHYPTEAYEVEFRADGQPVRVLLLNHQITTELEQE